MGDIVELKRYLGEQLDSIIGDDKEFYSENYKDQMLEEDTFLELWESWTLEGLQSDFLEVLSKYFND